MHHPWLNFLSQLRWLFNQLRILILMNSSLCLRLLKSTLTVGAGVLQAALDTPWGPRLGTGAASGGAAWTRVGWLAWTRAAWWGHVRAPYQWSGGLDTAVQWGDLENLGWPSRGLTWLRHGPHVHMAGPGVEPQLAVGHAGVGEAEEPRQHHQHSGGEQHPEGGSGQTWPGVNRLIKLFRTTFQL